MRHGAAKTRSAILNAAHVAFFRHGYSRVWMTDIAKAAGVTKRTLYKYFDSKDALLAAMLEEQAALSAETFARSIDFPAESAEDLVATIFEQSRIWSESKGWTGPGITRLAMELGDLPGHPAMQFASRHKAQMERRLAQRLEALGLLDAEAYARKIWLLLEGAMMLALIHKDRDYFRTAASAANSLVAGKTP